MIQTDLHHLRSNHGKSINHFNQRLLLRQRHPYIEPALVFVIGADVEMYGIVLR
jgi:hypothetical protein